MYTVFSINSKKEVDKLMMVYLKKKIYIAGDRARTKSEKEVRW